MLSASRATSGFAVDDLERARDFYEGTLGLRVEVLDAEHGVTKLKLAGECDAHVPQRRHEARQLHDAQLRG